MTGEIRTFCFAEVFFDGPQGGIMKSMTRYRPVLVLAMLVASHGAAAAALDDVNLEVSRDLCAGAGANDKNFIVYATNLNSNQAIDANFKYDSSPAQQHFILFDAGLNPITDRFPKVSHAAPGTERNSSQ